MKFILEPMERMFNGARVSIKRQPLHRMFDENLSRNPDAIAVLFEEGLDSCKMTYRDLFEASNRLGRVLFDLMLEDKHIFRVADPVIAFRMKPSCQMIVTMLAVWRVGCGYFPMDVNDRTAHIKQMLTELKPQLVIIDDYGFDDPNLAGMRVQNLGDLFKRAKKEQASEVFDVDSLATTSDNAAIVLYSTTLLRAPRGSALYHENCQQRIEWQLQAYPFLENETHCIAHNSYFHVDHFAEIWAPLMDGKCLVLVNDAARNDIPVLIEKMEKHKVMRFYGRPSKIQQILERVKSPITPRKTKLLQRVKLWVSSGDEMPKSLAMDFFDYYENDGSHAIANFYGCTETTGDCCTYLMQSREQVEHLETIPIGFPTCNTGVYLLDAERRKIRAGEVGEIYVAGQLLAMYHVDGDEDIETRRFFRNPYSLSPQSWSLFRTSDYGRVENGRLHFVARMDRKCRAGDDYTIDLNELERLVNRLVYIDRAIVTRYSFKLLAFVQLNRRSSDKGEKEVEADLGEHLPAFAVPKVVLIFKMPVRDEGGIDLDQLIAEYEEQVRERRERTLHVTYDFAGVLPEDRRLTEDVFRIIGANIGFDLNTSIALRSNYFAIGGSATNVVSCVGDLRAEDHYINLKDFLDAKSLAQVIQKIRENESMALFDERALTVGRNTNWRVVTAYTEDAEEAAQLIADHHISKNTLYKFFPSLTRDNIYKFITENWYYFVNKQLSFKLVQLNTNRILGVCLNLEIEDEKLLEMEEMTAVKMIPEYLAFLAQDFDFKQYNYSKVLMPYISAALTTLTAEDEIRLHYQLEKHLLNFMRNYAYEAVVTSSTSPLNIQIRKFCFGYRTFKEFPVNRFIDERGERPFKTADKALKTFTQVYENKDVM